MTETKKNQIHEMHDPVDSRSTTEQPSLNDNLFARELGYQVCLAIVDRLLGLGLLTTTEVHKAKGLLLATYRPPIGTLLAEAG